MNEKIFKLLARPEIPEIVAYIGIGGMIWGTVRGHEAVTGIGSVLCLAIMVFNNRLRKKR